MKVYLHPTKQTETILALAGALFTTIMLQTKCQILKTYSET